MIPPEMAQYFFFDGEAAESFTTVRNFKQISEAIKNILGSTLANTAIQDLKGLEKTITKHLTQIPGEDKLATIDSPCVESKKETDQLYNYL